MKVKVWNDNKYVYKEKFREKNIEIPPHSFIEMEFDEAHTFKGSFAPILRDADGNPIPQGFKMIRLEEPSGAALSVAKTEDLMCQKCRYLAMDAKDLTTHLKTHSDDTIELPEAEAEIAAKRRGRPPGKAAAQAG